MASHYVENGVPQKKPMSLWWPMSMLIGWVLFIALGAGLIGGSVAQYSSCLDDTDFGSSFSSSVRDCNGAGRGASPMFIGGVACVVIGGLFHLLFWILLIVWLVKRSNHRRAQTVYVHQAATPAPGYNNHYAAPAYGQQQYQQQPHYYGQQQQAAQPNYYAKA